MVVIDVGNVEFQRLEARYIAVTTATSAERQSKNNQGASADEGARNWA